MAKEPNASLKKISAKKIILFTLVLVILTTGFIFYTNFNSMLSKALQNAFESSTAAEVYDLKFDNLQVNPISGTIRVFDVKLQPKENPSTPYTYINSTIRLETKELMLREVDILLLLRSNKLVLNKIAIIEPDLELDINGKNPTFLPTKTKKQTPASELNSIPNSYLLNEFELKNASFRLINSVEERDFNVEDFNMSFKELSLDEQTNLELIFLKEMEISMGKFTGIMKKNGLKHLSFQDFKVSFDSIAAQKNLDTLIFNYKDFSTSITDLDIHTQDSLFHITMQSFDLSYLERAVHLKKLSFKPNVSNSVIQKNYKFQHTQFSGTVKSIDLLGVNFDSLIHYNSLFIEEVDLDSIAALIYKDNTKAKDLNHFPKYLGQAITELKEPLRIKTLAAKQVHITNEERKPDGTLARVNINNGTIKARNITNLAPNESLALNAEAYLAGKVKVNLDLNFSYSKPQFTFVGELEKFQLTAINPIVKAYTPAEFKDGTVDEIKFSGTALSSSASGNLTFLYHDLKVDLQLHKKENWVNEIVSFGANTALHTHNPATNKQPPRAVKFYVDRDMNKGFINLIIKSILDGMKETMILSKENRKEFHQAKKEAKREAREEKKKDNP